jgi:CBS domain-containing protein
MTQGVITIPESMPLANAALRLARHHISAAPVVDADGRYVGVLRAIDYVHWAEEGAPAQPAPTTICPFRVEGRLLTGENAVICTLGHGGCPWQTVRPLTGGRHGEVCVRPPSEPGPFDRVPDNLPISAVKRYMHPEVVTASPQTPLAELARRMLAAHVPQIVIIDERETPVGIVSVTDMLGAIASVAGGAADDASIA